MPKNYQELLDLEKRFEHYLQSMGVKKEELTPYRLVELRSAFMGGLSSAIVLVNQDLDGLNEMQSMNCLAHVLFQVDGFWKNQAVSPYPSLSLEY